MVTFHWSAPVDMKYAIVFAGMLTCTPDWFVALSNMAWRLPLLQPNPPLTNMGFPLMLTIITSSPAVCDFDGIIGGRVTPLVGRTGDVPMPLLAPYIKLNRSAGLICVPNELAWYKPAILLPINVGPAPHPCCAPAGPVILMCVSPITLSSPEIVVSLRMVGPETFRPPVSSIFT